MNDKNNCYCDDKLYHVGCDVVNCKYHGSDNHCHADRILVESTNATRKSETFCGTFTAKSEF